MNELYLKKGWNVSTAARHLGMTTTEIEAMLNGALLFDEIPPSIEKKMEEIFSRIQTEDESQESIAAVKTHTAIVPKSIVIEGGYEKFVDVVGHLFTTQERKILKHCKQHSTEGLCKLLRITKAEISALKIKAQHTYESSEFCRLAEQVYIHGIKDEKTLTRLILHDEQYPLPKRSLVAFMCLDDLEKIGDSPIHIDLNNFNELTNFVLAYSAKIVLHEMAQKYPFIFQVFEIQNRVLA